MDGYAATARAMKASRVADTLEMLTASGFMETLVRAKDAARAADLTPEASSRLDAALDQARNAAGRCGPEAFDGARHRAQPGERVSGGEARPPSHLAPPPGGAPGPASGANKGGRANSSAPASESRGVPLPASSASGSGASGKAGSGALAAKPRGASLDARAKTGEPGLFVTLINFALNFADALRSRETTTENAAKWRELAALIRRARLAGVTCQLMAAYAGERKKSPDGQAAKTILAQSLHELDGIVSKLAAFYGDASCPDCGLAAEFAHTTISRLLPGANAR